MELRPITSVFAKGLCLILALCLSVDIAAAGPRINLFEREKRNIDSLSEFIYGDEVADKLSPVYLLGSVRKPGLYHVPPKTSLTTLLSIAGGPSEESDIEDITIRNEETQRLDKVDFKRVIADKGMKSPILNPRDVILVGTRTPAFSNNTVLTLSVLGTLATLVLTGIVIKKSL